METKKRAAGYIRVSGKHQVEGESLKIQKEKIYHFAKLDDYKITKIYSDEGKSGKNVKDRPDLLKLLDDAEAGKFEMVIIYCLDRFGRNSIELQQNYEYLKNFGIELASVKEKMDFSTPQGKFYYQMLAAMSEMERQNIRERMYSGKISKANRGIPPTPKLPYARTYNRKTNKWGMDKQKANIIREAADRFINRESLMDIASDIRNNHTIQMSYDHLKQILKNRCGNTWNIKFKELKDPIVIKIPRILEDRKIKQIHKMLEFNRRFNRKDVEAKEKYLLSGFIRCEKCQRALMGQTQVGQQKNYRYYQHGSRKDDPCKPRPFSSIDAERIERAVIEVIFENFWQKCGFEKAIANNFDDKYWNEIKKKLVQGETRLKTVKGEIDKVVLKVAKDLITDKEAEKTINDLRQNKIRLEHEINKLNGHYQNIRKKELTKLEAERLRQKLVEKYSDPKQLKKMTFEEKRKILHWLFNGKAPNGDPYGIYISKRGRGKNAEIDYFVYGGLTGIRTIKGDNLDYFDQSWLEEESIKPSVLNKIKRPKKIQGPKTLNEIWDFPEDMQLGGIVSNRKPKYRNNSSNKKYKSSSDQFVDNLI